MARRKDHSPDELRQLIRHTVLELVHKEGLQQLTARKIARQIGYSPGTLYNLYTDMDSLIQDVNRMTLQDLRQYCLDLITPLPVGIDRIMALAHGYYDYACTARAAWMLLFRPIEVPDWAPDYRQSLRELFDILARTLSECCGHDQQDALTQTHLFWGSLHGITMLALDGRLDLVGAADPRALVSRLVTNIQINNKN